MGVAYILQVLEAGTELADAIEEGLPAWINGCVEQRMTQAFGASTDEARLKAKHASERAVRELVPVIRDLLARDVDEQWTTPLALVREAVRYPTEVLAECKVPTVARDRFVGERFPNDVYALTPANLSELGENVADLAIIWGANKAWEHKRRHGKH